MCLQICLCQYIRTNCMCSATQHMSYVSRVACRVVCILLQQPMFRHAAHTAERQTARHFGRCPSRSGGRACLLTWTTALVVRRANKQATLHIAASVAPVVMHALDAGLSSWVRCTPCSATVCKKCAWMVTCMQSLATFQSRACMVVSRQSTGAAHMRPLRQAFARACAAAASTPEPPTQSMRVRMCMHARTHVSWHAHSHARTHHHLTNPTPPSPTFRARRRCIFSAGNRPCALNGSSRVQAFRGRR